MQQIATITSKRQLTIPVKIFRSLNLKEGYKVVISTENNTIRIIPALSLVEKLAGSVIIPEKFKGLPIEKIVEKAKNSYFKNKK